MYRLLASVLTLACLSGAACGQKPASAPEAQPKVPAVTAAAPEAVPVAIHPVKRPGMKYAPEGSPTRAIQDLDDVLESYILGPKTPEEIQYNENLKKQVLRGIFDIHELSRRALDKHWDERTPQEQDYFVDLMTRLLERKAVFSKEQGQKKIAKKSKELYRITYEGDRPVTPDKLQSLVMSSVHVPTEDLKISLNYKLKRVENGWKIFDVIVDGASLLDNYKYQFDRIISKDGYPVLVHRMESKLKSLQESSGKE